MEMPSQEEQRIAEDYVLVRLLHRPDTDIKKAIKCVGIYLLSSLALSISMFYLFSWLGIFAFFPGFIRNFSVNHPVWFAILFVLFVCLIIGLFFLKKAAIGCIRLYQHYAPEDIRRRCLFKPTCSEYAILAIEKFGLLVGLYKTYIRLFKKCRGTIYGIDFP